MELLFASVGNAEETATALKLVEENGSEDFEVSNVLHFMFTFT